MGKAKTIVGIVIAFIALGFVFDVTNVIALLSLKVEGEGMKGLDISTPSFEKGINVVYKVKMKNPSSFDAYIKSIYYEVYIEGEFIGRNVIHDIYVPAGSTKTVGFPINITSLKPIFKVISAVLQKGHVNYEIKGYVEVPVKWYIWTIFSIKIPYDIRSVYKP